MKHRVTIMKHREVEREIEIDFPLYTREQYHPDERVTLCKYDSPDKRVCISYFGDAEVVYTHWYELEVVEKQGIVANLENLPEKVLLSDRFRSQFETALARLKAFTDRFEP